MYHHRQVLNFTLSPSDDESRVTTGLCAPNRLLDMLDNGATSALFDEVKETRFFCVLLLLFIFVVVVGMSSTQPAVCLIGFSCCLAAFSSLY